MLTQPDNGNVKACNFSCICKCTFKAAFSGVAVHQENHQINLEMVHLDLEPSSQYAGTCGCSMSCHFSFSHSISG